jgi:hypothetical protein
MGVFPLADTMSCFSNPSLSRGGNTCVPVDGRTDEVWWHPHPTTNPHRNAAAANPSIHYIDCSHAITRCPGTDTSSRLTSAGRYIRRHPTVRIPDWTDGSVAERGPPVRHLPHAGTLTPSGVHAALEPS